MEQKRCAGVLLHITSLPSKYGVGTLGKEAFDFIDFLKKSNVSIWQVLPLVPTNYGDSPYQSVSSTALNYYLIDFDNNKYKASIKINSNVLPFLEVNSKINITYIDNEEIKEITKIN